MADSTDFAPGPRSDFKARLPSDGPWDIADITWAPAWRLREWIAAGQLSAVEIVEHFLMRIETLDPVFHAFRQRDADRAREDARRADVEMKSGSALGPLHGIPIAIKEFLPIKGFLNHPLAGDAGVRAEHDALEVERLRAAGAIIIGPTVAGLAAREFGDSDRMPLNPWDTDRVCGDSSSGSAAAVTAALTPLAIAGDGLGSTRLPASFCGLVGLHPTRGLVPSFDWGSMGTRPLTTYGPLARDVRDAAVVLSVLAGPDGRELMGLPDSPPDYLSGLENGARGVKLLWTDDFGYASAFAVEESARVIETVRAAALKLCDAGARVEQTHQVFENPAGVANKVMISDPSLAVFVAPTRQEVVTMREARQRIWSALVAAMTGHDFIVTPTILSIAPTRKAWAAGGVAGDFSGLYTTMTGVANLLGWPAMSVPAGLVDGLPVGLQILGRPRSEALMLQLAQAFLAIQPAQE